MALSHFFAQLSNSAIGAQPFPTDEAMDRMRRLMQRSLIPEFRFELAGALLEGIARKPNAWVEKPIWTDPRGCFSVRVWAWPARLRTSCHSHAAWGVTGVLDGKLNAQLFDVRSGVLRVGRVVTGTSGEVGCLKRPCVHQVSNALEETSLSIHMYGHHEDAEVRSRLDSAIKSSQVSGSQNSRVGGPRLQGEVYLSAILRMSLSFTDRKRASIARRVFSISRGFARHEAAVLLARTSPDVGDELMQNVLERLTAEVVPNIGPAHPQKPRA